MILFFSAEKGHIIYRERAKQCKWGERKIWKGTKAKDMPRPDKEVSPIGYVYIYIYIYYLYIVYILYLYIICLKQRGYYIWHAIYLYFDILNEIVILYYIYLQSNELSHEKYSKCHRIIMSSYLIILVMTLVCHLHLYLYI